MTGANGKEQTTQAEAAKRLGITPQALGVWTRRPGAPVVLKNGRPFCLWPDFPRWREAELSRQVREESKPGNAAEAVLLFEAMRARKMEMEVEVLEGKLVPIEDTEKTVDAMLTQLRSQIVTLPQRWAPRLVGVGTLPKVQAVLEDAANELMGSLSK